MPDEEARLTPRGLLVARRMSSRGRVTGSAATLEATDRRHPAQEVELHEATNGFAMERPDWSEAAISRSRRRYRSTVPFPIHRPEPVRIRNATSGSLVHTAGNEPTVPLK